MKGALNVPVSSILDKEFKELFVSEAVKVILAHDPVVAHETWMLLTQLGYENFRVMKVEKGM